MKTPGRERECPAVHLFLGEPPVSDVLQCLKKHGQRLDLEIAEETCVPLAAVRERLTELSAAGAVVMCRLTRYEGAKTIEAWQCRMSGFVPPVAPGRKPKAA
jgi:transcription initiation factor IIE alpha subunit